MRKINGSLDLTICSPAAAGGSSCLFERIVAATANFCSITTTAHHKNDHHALVARSLHFFSGEVSGKRATFFAYCTFDRIFTETKWVLLESLLFIYLSWGDPWGKYRKSSEDRGSYPENNTSYPSVTTRKQYCYAPNQAT